MNTGVEVEVSIERLDDVSFQKGTALELLQTKHHIDRVANLSDASEDLWKTLRVWSVAAKDDPSLPSRARLALITTGSAPVGAAASLLRPPGAYAPGAKRDPKSANERLTEVAQTSKNKALAPAFAAFLALSEPMRSALLSAVEVLDNQPLITDLDGELEHALRLVAPPRKAAVARAMLEGWWWPMVCGALVTSPPTPIAIGLVEAKLDDIREMLRRDSLVADFEHAEPDELDYAGYDGFRFVQQLQVIGLGGNRLRFAKRDFYRAFAQRSKWTRDHVVLDDEVAKFEQRLVEEWQPRFEAMCDDHADSAEDQAALKQGGQILYQWVENEARFPFRSLTARFLNVGSYHILANDLRIGWHRDYVTICEGET
ncbi:ABC-three component system protein [Sphingomonas endolithica]|uniref:ABC-three component system protein n=1 Tax=Sphingomonas endolithica TaxID=2972485 RepID=UPI0021AED559|nr:ABC-three component system protein [Sphingomonas sp. ZFBP2030]